MNVKRTNWLAAILLTGYSALLIRFVVFKAVPTIAIGHMRIRFAGTHTGPSNLVPFKTIATQLAGRGNHLVAMVNLLGNIVLFLPLGFLAPLAFPIDTWRKAIVLGICSGLSCEVLEVVFRVGIFDVDDLLLNAFGVLLGFAVFALFEPKSRIPSRSSPQH
ncbi:VanZ family protein [Edaphobacter sp. 12200R-103]|uniref:VanZ family protein n=1 Tax=Edaphobacter sp. 12200R-103 TaxID=2703788 RepID=UPI00138D9351|nr:VanZ family protein [Edaphobacter sp. 12200R-103]QHS53215.1 hypothetical protein GWR55_16965 [Edaphobacter sp. 12200R-103]